MAVEDSDILKKIALASAMRNILDLEDKGPCTKSTDEIFGLYVDLCELADKGLDPFEFHKIRVWDIYDAERLDYSDGLLEDSEDHYLNILNEISSQANSIFGGLRELLKVTHAGLVDMTIEGELDPDANGWDLAHAANVGARKPPADALATDASNRSKNEPSL